MFFILDDNHEPKRLKYNEHVRPWLRHTQAVPTTRLPEGKELDAPSLDDVAGLEAARPPRPVEAIATEATDPDEKSVRGRYGDEAWLSKRAPWGLVFSPQIPTVSCVKIVVVQPFTALRSCTPYHATDR